MLDQRSAGLQWLLGDGVDLARLRDHASFAAVVPGETLCVAGQPVSDVLLVESGVLEVETAHEPLRWASAGAIVGLSAALLQVDSPDTVTAIRHGRVARIPIQALWELGGASSHGLAAVLRFAQFDRTRDEGLSILPPDPLVIAAVIEGLDVAGESAIASLLETAVARFPSSRIVRATAAADSIELCDELSACEARMQTVVYVIGAGAGAKGGAVTAHADRVLLFQPPLTSGEPSVAHSVACDGSARRHTEVVYVSGGVQASTDSTRRMRTPAHVRRTHLFPELSATRLELLLAELRHEAREHDRLRQFELFSELTLPELAWVQRHLQWKRVDGGSLLVRQGHVADALWLLRAGRLSVVRETNAGERLVASLGAGSVVGEAAILSGTAHAESVRALRDSTVARLDRSTALALMERSTGFARVVARVIARDLTTRSHGESDPRVRNTRTITVVPLAAPDRVRHFVDRLAEAMIREGSRATIVDGARLELALGSRATSTRRGDVGDAEIITWLNRLEEQVETVLLVCGMEPDSWMRRATRQSDALLFVADAGASTERRATEMALLEVPAGTPTTPTTGELEAPHAFAGERHLLLLQPAGIAEATGTDAWLAERGGYQHHHVRDHSADDLARVARRLTGRAVAVALSGAASRAPAHFGVLRAMRDHGLPVDMMSGSSSGAGVAAIAAMGFPDDVALEHALSIIRNGIPTFRQFQPPITALTSGREANEVLRSVYGDRLLENQIIPSIVTAVDIRHHRLVLLTRGPIWKLIRASGSLPLLWPPVWHDDDLLVDGAILSYLPLDVFGGAVTWGLTIASHLEVSSKSGSPAFKRSLRYGTTLSGWCVLMQRLMGRKVRAPRLVEILYHAMAIPSFQQQESLAHLARENLCILTPQLGNFGLFGADAKTGRRLEKETWEYSVKMLEPVAERWRAGRATPA